MINRKSVLFVLLLPVAAAAEIDVNNPPTGVFSDEWYAVMMAGQKSGHMHGTMERLKVDGVDVIRTKTTMKMVAGRGQTPITVTMDQQTDETLDGKPLRFKNKLSLGKMPSTTEGRIKDGKVTVTSWQLGIPTDKKVYDLPEGAMMSWGLYREQLERGLKPGTKYDLSIYEPSIAPDKLTTATIEIFDKETLDLFGRKVEAIKSRQTMTIPGLVGGEMSLSTTTWLTEEGEPVRLEMNMMDIPIEILACPKAFALSKDDPADIMAQTLITVPEPIDTDARELTLRLEWSGEGKVKPGMMPETDMQKVIHQDAKSVTIRNTRHSARPAKQGTLSKEEKERYLAPTSTVNHKDPVVADLARKAAGTEKDPAKLADKLRKFVSDYIDSKNLNVGFATAAEVARSKEGDCTEHGVLLAALGRAKGIPTRVATGIVYTDHFVGKQNVFVGHLWTQFWIDGQWVDVDAALEQTDVDPTHITLAVSDAGDSGLADLAGSIWVNMGKPRISVMTKPAETQPAPK